VILKSNVHVIKSGASKVLEKYADTILNETVAFSPPKESLEKSLDNLNVSQNEISTLNNTLEEYKEKEENQRKHLKNSDELVNNDAYKEKDNWCTEENTEPNKSSTSFIVESSSTVKNEYDKVDVISGTIDEIKYLSVTDEEKEQRLALESPLVLETSETKLEEESLINKPFLETVLNSLYCIENDYAALFALCLLYALANNQVMLSNLFFSIVVRILKHH
jgi:protein CLEC16A